MKCFPAFSVINSGDSERKRAVVRHCMTFLTTALQNAQADSTNNDALELQNIFSKFFRHVKIDVVQDVWEDVGEMLLTAENEAKRTLKYLI